MTQDSQWVRDQIKSYDPMPDPDLDKRKEILVHLEATYRPPEDTWLRAFFALQVKRAGPKELNDMLNIVRSKKK